MRRSSSASRARMYSEGKAGWPFGALGLDEPSNDAKVIKRAYARQLKQVDQASEAEAFQALRQAYETALDWAEKGSEPEPQLLTEEDTGILPGVREPGAPARKSAAHVEFKVEFDPLLPPERQRVAPMSSECKIDQPDEDHVTSLKDLLQAVYDLEPSGDAPDVLVQLLEGVENMPLHEQQAVGSAVVLYLRKCLVQREGAGYFFNEGFNSSLRDCLEALFHWWTDVEALERFAGHDDDLKIALLSFDRKSFRSSARADAIRRYVNRHFEYISTFGSAAIYICIYAFVAFVSGFIFKYLGWASLVFVTILFPLFPFVWHSLICFQKCIRLLYRISIGRFMCKYVFRK